LRERLSQEQSPPRKASAERVRTSANSMRASSATQRGKIANTGPISTARGYIEPLLRGDNNYPRQQIAKPPRPEYRSFEKENNQAYTNHAITSEESYCHDQEIDKLLKSTYPEQ